MERYFLVLGDATWEVSEGQDLSVLRERIRAVTANGGGFLDFLDASEILRTVTVPSLLVESLELVARASDAPVAPSWLRDGSAPGAAPSGSAPSADPPAAPSAAPEKGRG